MYKNSEEIIRAGLETLREAIIQRSDEAGQRASGETYSLLTVEDTSLSHGELHGPAHIAVLEDGRKPGKVPEDFVEIIKEWATFKGIEFANAEPEVFEKWANAVKWNIIKHGTQLYRSGQKLDILETPIREFEEWLTEQIKVFYTTEIINNIRTAWQNI